MAKIFRSFLLLCAFTTSLSVLANSDVAGAEPSENNDGISLLHDHGGSQCHNIYNQYRCNRTRNCTWNHWANRCTSDWNGGGGDNGGGDGHGGWRCNNIHSPRHCERTHGCEWNWRRDRCVSRY